MDHVLTSVRLRLDCDCCTCSLSAISSPHVRQIIRLTDVDHCALHNAHDRLPIARASLARLQQDPNRTQNQITRLERQIWWLEQEIDSCNTWLSQGLL